MQASTPSSSTALLMFDFDGVIADSLDHQCRAHIETLKASDFAELATAEQFLAFTEDNWFEALARADLPTRVVEELEEAFVALPCPELFPEMATVIERLARSHAIVVITSSRTGVVRRILRRHGVRGVAEVMGGDQERSKTRKIESVRRRFGCLRAVWYVGDTVGDILEAQAAGVGTVAVAWGWHGAERLRRVAPDHLAERPADLLDLFDCEKALDETH